MSGLSLPQVGAVLVHRSAQTTLRYADHVIDAVRSYSEQIGAAFAHIAEVGRSRVHTDGQGGESSLTSKWDQRGFMPPIVTERLDLLQATPTLIRAELASLDALGALLDATVPQEWPPEFFERDDLERALAWAEADDFDPAWGMRYFLTREPRRLVGVGGFYGPPKENTVMLGYAVARPFRGLGYATEATLGLVAFAFAHPSVDRVAAETLPELTASIRVLEKAGFRRGGSAQTHPGAIRFERDRVRSDLQAI